METRSSPHATLSRLSEVGDAPGARRRRAAAGLRCQKGIVKSEQSKNRNFQEIHLWALEVRISELLRRASYPVGLVLGTCDL